MQGECYLNFPESDIEAKADFGMCIPVGLRGDSSLEILPT